MTTQQPWRSVDEIPKGLLGLVRQIPPESGSWTREERERFLSAFCAVLDFSVPKKERRA